MANQKQGRGGNILFDENRSTNCRRPYKHYSCEVKFQLAHWFRADFVLYMYNGQSEFIDKVFIRSKREEKLMRRMF